MPRWAERGSSEPEEPEVVSSTVQLLRIGTRGVHPASWLRTRSQARQLDLGEALQPPPVACEVSEEGIRDRTGRVLRRKVGQLAKELDVMEPVEIEVVFVLCCSAQPRPQVVEVGVPDRSERAERPTARAGEPLCRDPTLGTVLRIVKVDRTQNMVDSEPGQERQPALLGVELGRLFVVLVDVHLVV